MRYNRKSNFQNSCDKFQQPCFISISACDQSNCCTPVFLEFSTTKLLQIINQLNQAILSFHNTKSNNYTNTPISITGIK